MKDIRSIIESNLDDILRSYPDKEGGRLRKEKIIAELTQLINEIKEPRQVSYGKRGRSKANTETTDVEFDVTSDDVFGSEEEE